MIGESDGGRHFACTMPSVMLRMLRKEGGAEAVTDVLERAGSMRSPEYLEDVTNWISSALSLIAVPIVAHGHLLGLLTVAVHSRRERLDARQDLLDRLSGVAAHAASALENGRLIDRV